ncbi:MAG: glycosyltransferase family 2 protein [Exiguobacterium sp.]|nr:glycosyltransferase family 2 protein [Exiguobacterium sp.]
MKTLLSSNIKLTVIMPLFEQPLLYKIGLDSIPARDDIEIIVIDDGSGDNSLEEVREYQLHSDKNIVVLHNRINSGVAFTVNKGLDNANGEYVVLLGSDGDYFVGLDKAMEELDGTDLIYFDLEINSGEHLDSKAGSSKFMRREFIGNTRVPLLVNSEDNAFYELLLKKNPTEKYIDCMYKHYNYPREGSLVWNVIHNKTKRGERWGDCH